MNPNYFKKNQQRVHGFQFPIDQRITSKTYSHLQEDPYQMASQRQHYQQLRRTYGQSIQHNRQSQKQYVRNSRKSSKSYHSNSKYQNKGEKPKSKISIRQSIPQLMQQMEEVLHKKNKQTDSSATSQLASIAEGSSYSQISNKYPSQVSVLKSAISVLTKQAAEDDIRLPQLQRSLAQIILQLRQQKISLLAVESEIIDQKNQAQRSIRKILKNRNKLHQLVIQDNVIQVNLEKEKEILSFNPDSKKYKNLANKKAYFPVMQRYLQLKRKQKNLQQFAKQNQEEYQNRLAKIYQQNPDLKSEYEKYEKLNQQMQQAQYALNSQTYEQTIKQLNQKIINLQGEKSKLQSTINLDKFQQIISLRQQNKKLINQANNMLSKKKRLGQVTSIDGLMKIVSIQDELKEQLFSQMKTLKKQYDTFIKENNEMKKILGNNF